VLVFVVVPVFTVLDFEFVLLFASGPCLCSGTGLALRFMVGGWFVVCGPVFVLGRDRDCDCVEKSNQSSFVGLVHFLSISVSWHFQRLSICYWVILMLALLVTFSHRVQRLGDHGLGVVYMSG
jgi:hypothetical protein